MLSHVVRHRMFVVCVSILAIVAALAAPTKHDYSTSQQGSLCEVKDGRTQCVTVKASQTTEVHYGLPATWLRLSKRVEDQTNKPVSSSNHLDVKGLAIDAGSYALVLAVCFGFSRLDIW